jgi:hypothetical protein
MVVFTVGQYYALSHFKRPDQKQTAATEGGGGIAALTLRSAVAGFTQPAHNA